jgi:hypothetical protein
MIRAENLPRVIETSAVQLYFCHDWAMAEPEDFISRAAGKPFQFKHSLHSEVGMHTASSPSLNRWKTLYQAAILETNKGLLPQRVSEASGKSPWTRNFLRRRNTREGSRSIGRRTLYVACVQNRLAAPATRVIPRCGCDAWNRGDENDYPIRVGRVGESRV